MIRKIISKYGLAAHLGLLAAFPIAAMPFLDANTIGCSLLWVSLFSLLWIFSEPSIRLGERSAEARFRVLQSILHDPVFYFFILAAVFALARYLNSGVQLGYDVEQRTWLVKDPAATVMPSSVGDAGFLPFVATVALGVLTMGVRNALGAAGRVFCGLTAVSIAGAAGLAAGIYAGTGKIPVLLGTAHCDFLHSPYLGTAFGFFALLAIMFGVEAETRKWRAARFPFVLAVAGCSTGLVFFTPPYAACIFLAVMLIFAIFALVYCARAGSMGGCARALVFLLMGLAVSAILMMGLASEELQQYKLHGLDPAVAFPAEYGALSQSYMRISKAIWLNHPWCGAGEGAYGLQLPFIAAKSDWALLPPHPDHALSGLLTLLSERGIVGCALLVIGLGMLLWAWGARFVEAFAYLRNNDDADVFPFACPPVVWVAPAVVLLGVGELFFASSFRSIACVFAYVVPLVLAGASFPRGSTAKVVEKTTVLALNEGK